MEKAPYLSYKFTIRFGFGSAKTWAHKSVQNTEHVGGQIRVVCVLARIFDPLKCFRYGQFRQGYLLGSRTDFFFVSDGIHGKFALEHATHFEVFVLSFH